MPDTNTPLDEVSRSVPDSAIGTEDDEKSRRLATLQKVAPRLAEVAERIDQIQRILGDNLGQLVKEQPLGVVVDLLAGIKEQVDRLHGDGSTIVTNALKKRIRDARDIFLPERLEDEGLRNFSTDGWRIARSSKTMASILGDHKDEAYEWLRSNDYADLIKPTVNASSLSAVAKELLEHGKELPEEIFRVHIQPTVSFTKVGNRRA
jgi:hypothetical protein